MCGLRKLAIRRRKELLVTLGEAIERQLNFKPGYRICPDCANHPAIGIFMLRRLNDGKNAQD